jgi:hypothetical protein
MRSNFASICLTVSQSSAAVSMHVEVGMGAGVMLFAVAVGSTIEYVAVGAVHSSCLR